MWSSNPTPEHVFGKDRKSNSKRYMHCNVQRSTIYNSQDMEAMQMSINRGMDKEDVVHTHKGILLGHKKEWNNAIYSNMDGPRDHHINWRPEKEIEISYDTTYMYNLKNDTNELIKQKQTQRHRKKLIISKEQRRGRIN